MLFLRGWSSSLFSCRQFNSRLLIKNQTQKEDLQEGYIGLTSFQLEFSSSNR